MIRLEGGDIVGLDIGPEPDFDLKLPQLAFVPFDQVENLRPARLMAREQEIAAQPRGGFRQNHLMAAFGRRPRRLKPPRSAADDQYPLRLLGWNEAVAAPFELPAGGRIDEATDPVVSRATSPAHLVARDAAANIPRPIL